MDGLTAFKFCAQICATLGVTKVVGDVIKNNVNVVTGLDLARVKIGSTVIGTLVTRQATKMVEELIDEAVIKFHERVEKAKEKKAEEEKKKVEKGEKKDVDD